MRNLSGRRVKKINNVVKHFSDIKKVTNSQIVQKIFAKRKAAAKRRARIARAKARFNDKKNKNRRNKLDKKYKKPRRKKRTPKQLLARLEAIKKIKPPAIPLNVDFYKSADGVYNSYWLGKLINTLLHDGKRKIVSKQVYKAFTLVKLVTGESPMILFLEILEQIKPLFRLRNYIVRRVIIKEFPIVVLRPRRLILAVH